MELSCEQANAKDYSLNDKWSLWTHLAHDTDWSIKSYNKIMTFDNMIDAISLFETIPESMEKNCMLFVMRHNIEPRWECDENRLGGCFSYKISNKHVSSTWKNLNYALIGEYLPVNTKYAKYINGTTISPKKNFCIIKIWLSTCKYQDPSIIKEIKHIIPNGCLFKKHDSENK